MGQIVDADGNILERSAIPTDTVFFVTTLNELKRAKAENREPIPLQKEPLTIEDMRRIVHEHDDKVAIGAMDHELSLSNQSKN